MCRRTTWRWAPRGFRAWGLGARIAALPLSKGFKRQDLARASRGLPGARGADARTPPPPRRGPASDFGVLRRRKPTPGCQARRLPLGRQRRQGRPGGRRPCRRREAPAPRLGTERGPPRAPRGGLPPGRSRVDVPGRETGRMGLRSEAAAARPRDGPAGWPTNPKADLHQTPKPPLKRSCWTWPRRCSTSTTAPTWCTAT
jgi:hypothetical protein